MLFASLLISRLWFRLAYSSVDAKPYFLLILALLNMRAR